jgi:acylphosphatase/soluble cytochrome b562
LNAYNLNVSGRVQRVGFRRYVLDQAQELSLTGHAKNLPNGSIEIFVQGENEQLAKFFEKLKQTPPPAEIRETKQEEATPDPELKEFKLVSADLSEELQEGFGAMQTIFTEEFRDYQKEFKDYKEEFRDYRQEFRDYRHEFREFANRTDENFRLMSEKYGEISAKLTVILETLVRESRETREMLNETMKSLKEALARLEK